MYLHWPFVKPHVWQSKLHTSSNAEGPASQIASQNQSLLLQKLGLEDPKNQEDPDKVGHLHSV